MSKTLPTLVEISPTSLLKVDAVDKTEHHNEYASGEWWLVYLTVGLVAVTAALAWYTARLYRATVALGKEAKETSERQRGEVERSLAISQTSAQAASRAADVAERSLIDLERPYVFLDLREPIFKGLVVTAGGKYSINFPQSRTPIKYGLINRGRTPALLTELYQRLVSADPLPINICDPDLERVVSLKGQDVGAGESHQCKIDFIVGEMTLESLYLIGFTRYTDIFRRRHITAFCAKYAIAENRFALIGGEQYNYTRDENDGAS